MGHGDMEDTLSHPRNVVRHTENTGSPPSGKRKIQARCHQAHRNTGDRTEPEGEARSLIVWLKADENWATVSKNLTCDTSLPV